MSNEAQDTLRTYFNGKTPISFFGESRPVNDFLEYHQKGTWLTGDSPDMINLYKNRCLIVEHFRFDCYKHTRKGSQNLWEQARIDRIAETVIPTEDGAVYRDQIAGQCSYKFYIENIERVFTEHYQKIPLYKRNLLDKDVISSETLVEIAFLIEDVTPLGTVTHDGLKLQPINLACCKPFLALFRNSPEVRFAIACSSYSNNEFVWLISRDEIDEFFKNSLEYEKMDFISFNPKVMGFKTIIPATKITRMIKNDNK